MTDYSVLPKIPLDDEEYTVSFTVDQEEEIKSFYTEFGFVVIRDAISANNADAAYTDLWDLIEGQATKNYEYDVSREQSRTGFTGFLKPKPVKKVKLTRNDVSTWEEYWPMGKGGKGLVGNGVVTGKPAWANRQAENLYKAFSIVIGTDDLLVSCDRYGFLRPTKDIPMGNQLVCKPEWTTTENWVHWDLNPWFWTKIHKKPETPLEITQALIHAYENGQSNILITENNEESDFKGFDKVQGLVSLADCKTEDGGFCCVPGFQKIIKSWSEHTEMYTRSDFVSVKKESEIIAHLQKVPMRKGSCVIWSSCLPHCNYPNSSAKPRACQYIKMFPKQVLSPELQAARKILLTTLLREADFTPSPLGVKLFGLE